jgi:hypothetical protein
MTRLKELRVRRCPARTPTPGARAQRPTPSLHGKHDTTAPVVPEALDSFTQTAELRAESGPTAAAAGEARRGARRDAHAAH